MSLEKGGEIKKCTSGEQAEGRTQSHPTVRVRPYQTGSAPNGHSRGGGDQLVPRADGLVPPRVSSAHTQLVPRVNSRLGSSERCERESGLVQLPLGEGGCERLQGYHSLDRLDAARETDQGMDF